ncbi:MAG: hypothetical protein ACOVQL_03375 [Limnohabitans sp.]
MVATIAARLKEQVPGIDMGDLTDDVLTPHLNSRKLAYRVKKAIGAAFPRLSALTMDIVMLSRIDSTLEDVPVFYRDAAAVVVQLLSDTSLCGDRGQNLDFNCVWRDDFPGCEFVRMVRATAPELDLCILNLFLDESAPDWLMTWALCPVSVVPAEFKRSVRLATGSSGLLGYLPRVRRPTAMSAAKWLRLKPRITQELFRPFVCSMLRTAQNGA